MQIHTPLAFADRASGAQFRLIFAYTVFVPNVQTWTHDVRAHPQPVRIKELVASPGLQISHTRWKRRTWRDDGSGRRMPQEVAARVGDFHLRHEEVMIRWQVEWRGEGHVELHFLARCRTVPPGGLTWHGVDSSWLHRIEHRKAAKV